MRRLDTGLTTLDTDLRVAAMASLVCAVVVVTVPVTAVRAVFAVPLCLILPGFAFTASTFGWARPSWLVRLVVVPAMSLVTLVLAALLLDVIPGGLNEISWAVVLVVIVMGECLVAGMRRAAAVTGDRLPPAPRATSARRPGRTRRGIPAPSGRGKAGVGLGAWRSVGLNRSQALILVLAGVLAGGALVFSRIPLGAPNAIGYTQLWMFSTGTPSAPAVSIAIKSGEQRPTTYQVAVLAGSGAPTIVVPRLTLRPGHGTRLSIPLHGVPGPESLVITRLYRVGHPGIYRQVSALVASTSKPKSKRSTRSPSKPTRVPTAGRSRPAPKPAGTRRPKSSRRNRRR